MEPSTAPAAHSVLVQAAGALRVSRSELRNRVSVHRMPPTTPFSSMFGFQKIASAERHAERTFVGSLGGEIVFSLNTGYATGLEDAGKCGVPPKKRKRARDTADEDAERCTQKVYIHARERSVSERSLEAGRECLAALLKLRGAQGERIVESYVLSVRKKNGTTDGLVLGTRLSAGVPVSMSALCEAVRTCRDGLFTVDGAKLKQDFDLPLSDQGKAADASGQKSLLLMASVPHIPDPEADAPSPKESAKKE